MAMCLRLIYIYDYVPEVYAEGREDEDVCPGGEEVAAQQTVLTNKPQSQTQKLSVDKDKIKT